MVYTIFKETGERVEAILIGSNRIEGSRARVSSEVMLSRLEWPSAYGLRIPCDYEFLLKSV